MPVTALSRRSLFLALFPQDAGPSRADITDMFAAVAASLSEDNPDAALKWFHPSMPGLAALRRSFHALVENFEVASAISVLSVENGSVDLDWYLELKSRATFGAIDRRRGRVKCKVGMEGKLLRIKNLEPVEFFN